MSAGNATGTDQPKGRPRVLVVGEGFAGFHCVKELQRRLRGDAVEIVLVSPTDYMLYLPLLPEVAAGILDPRHIGVSLVSALPHARLVLGAATAVDVDARTCDVLDATGELQSLAWDRLVLSPGSVTRILPVHGVAEYTQGFKTLAQALYLHDHVLSRLELAACCEDAEERKAYCTFVVVGAGYTGTEVAAQGQLLTRAALRRFPQLRDHVRWLLVDLAPRVLPGLSERLSVPAERVLCGRGVEVRLETTVEDVSEEAVRLSDGSTVSTRTVIWCVGVTPQPLVAGLGLPVEKGRLVVDEHLTVPDHPDVFALGDAAAVPDSSRPGEVTPMTAQHAQRQGKVAARNVAASLGFGEVRPYRHSDLGFVVDLGGWQAVANPLRIPISGVLGKVITRGYHLLALPGNRTRVAADWLVDALARRQLVQLGLVPRREARPADAEGAGRPLRTGRPAGAASRAGEGSRP